MLDCLAFPADDRRPSRSTAARLLGAVFCASLTAGWLGAGELQTTGTYPPEFSWIQRNASSPAARQGHVMTYDPTLQTMVVFGGDNGGTTLAFYTGLQWLTTTPGLSPSSRTGAAAAADLAKSLVVLYGGSTGSNETWEWDGFDWTQSAPVTNPGALQGHAMAFEGARRRTLLFGGLASSTPRNETWTWDHFDWTLQTPAVSPPARSATAMAYDVARDRVVLFGGRAAGGVTTDDTWEWDGTNWSEAVLSSSPSARSGHAMAYDASRGKIVLFGGVDGSNVRTNETWEYDATGWSLKTPASSPAARSGGAMAYDLLRGKLVAFGGSTTGLPAGDLLDTQEWDGTNWTQVAPFSSPSARSEGVASYTTGGGVLMFGGALTNGFTGSPTNETWKWNGTAWSKISPSSLPETRKWPGNMVYDASRNVNVLFGGSMTGLPARRNDTLEWDGTNWTVLTPTTRPAIRIFHGLAYANHLNASVLFGGEGSSRLDDTWTWDGTAWTALSPTSKPSGRQRFYFSYDEHRQRVVLFGGTTGSAGPYNTETWDFDGTNWTQQAPSVSPSARGLGSAVYDPDSRRVLIFGGQLQGSSVSTNELWAWNGANWTQLSPAASPSIRQMPYLAYDRDRHEAVLFGGYSSAGVAALSDTWVLPSRPATLAVTFSPDLRTGEEMTLSATYSQPDGLTPTFRWTQTFGPAATLTPSADGSRASVSCTVPGTLGIMCVAYNNSTWAYAFGGIRSVDSFVPASPATLTVDTLAFPARVSRGQTFAATVVMTNSGASTANVTSASLDFGTAGLAVTTSPGTPLTVGGHGSASFRFTVAVAADAATGDFTPAFTLQAGDAYFGSDVGLAVTTAAAVTVQTPAALSAGAVTLPATASKGHSFVATVPVDNTGQARAVIGSASLTFGGTGVTASADPANPTSLAGGAAATFAFDVTVSAGADSGSRAAALALGATDENSGLAAAVSYATTPAVTVQSPAALVFSALHAPALVTQGQSFAASVVVTNSGEANATLTSALLTFDGAELTATASPGNVSTLAGGASTTLSFAVETGSSAATGPRSASLALGARDANSGADASQARALSPSVTVQSPPALAFGALSASGPARQGRNFVARVDVANVGGATADVTAAGFAFSGSGLTVSASASNPTSVPGGTTATFAYDVAVSAGAATEPRVATLSLEAADRNSGDPANRSETLTPALDVFASPALALAAFASPARVSLGQTFTVTVTVDNSGNGAADITSAALAFSSAGITATTLPGQPSTLPAHAAEAFRFSVTASANTTPGPVSATAHVWALDPAFSDDAGVAGALTPTFLVQAPPHLAFGPLDVRATASQGQTLTATLAVANSGQATALLTSAELVFSGAGVTATPAATNPAQVPGETTATFVYTVAVAPDAAAEPREATLTARASDANSGTDASVTGLVTPGLIVQTPAVLSVGPLQAPAWASQGRTFTATVTVANTGGAAAAVTTATLTFGGSGLTASPEPGSPSSLAGGATATFSFAVDVAGTAAPGPRTASFAIAAADANSGADKSVSQPLPPGVEILSSASVVFSRLDTRTTATQGQTFAASVVVTSNGGQTAEITATALTFGGTGLTAVADPANPVSLASGQTATFRYTVTAGAAAAPGLRTATLRVSASDGNSGQDVTRQTALAPGVTLQTQAALVPAGLVAPATVSQGQVFQASVSVANTGGSTADVSGQALAFAGSGLTATAAGTPPAAIAGGATATFSYTVTVASGADEGPRTATLNLQASERNTGAARNLAAALAPAVTVQTPPSPVFGELRAPELVSQGQTFLTTVEALNSGSATLELTSAELAFAGSGLAATPLPGNPVSLAGGAGAVFAFSVTAGAGAAPGPRLATLALHGHDANSGASAGSTAGLTPPVTVQTPAALAFGSLEGPAALSQGQSYRVTVTVTNQGQAAFELSTAALAFSGAGVSASPRAGNPASIAGGSGEDLHFDVTVATDARLGDWPATLTVGGRDRNSDADATRSGALSPALRVEGKPLLSVRSVATGAVSVSRGQTVTGVAMTVFNSGNARATAVDAGLLLGSDAPGFATSRAGGTLPELAAGATVTLHFTVTVGPQAPLGPLTLDATATATDPVFGGTLADYGADVTATWLVQSAAALRVSRIDAPASLARRQSATATVELVNDGQARALVSLAALQPGHTGVTASAAPANPSAITGGATGRFVFTLSCATDAPLGTMTPTFRLTAADGNSAASAGVTTTLAPILVVKPPNSAPVAALSTSVVRVFYGTNPVLTASASDIDFGDVLSYRWSLTSRPFGSGADDTAFSPNGTSGAAATAFSPDRSGLYTVSLEAFDGTTASAPVTASVQILRDPVASVSGSPVATLHIPTRLDGSASRDLDGGLLTYQWTFVSKPASSLLTAGHLSPNFSPAASYTRLCADVNGTYTIRLSVSNGVRTSSAELSVAIGNSAPDAVVLGPPPGRVGEALTLLAAADDEDGDTLTYHWTVEESPAGGAGVTLSPNGTPSASTTQFTPAAPGFYRVSLVVSDGQVQTAPQSVSILVGAAANGGSASAPPVPKIRRLTNRVGGARLLRLSGRPSRTAAAGPVTAYSWSLVSSPPGALPFAATGITMSYSGVVPGEYTLRLTVADSLFQTASATATLTVLPLPPRPKAKVPPYILLKRGRVRPPQFKGEPRFAQAPDPGTAEDVKLDGTASNDPSGDAITYQWVIVQAPDTPSYAQPVDIIQSGTAKGESVAAAPDPTGADGSVLTTLTAFSATGDPRPQLFFSTAAPPEFAKTGREPLAAGLVDDRPYSAEGEYTYGLQVTTTDPDGKKKTALLDGLFDRVSTYATAGSGGITCSAGKNRKILVNFGPSGELTPTFDPVTQKKAGFIRLNGQVTQGRSDYDVEQIFWNIEGRPQGSKVDRLQIDPGLDVGQFNSALKAAQVRRLQTIFFPDLPGEYRFGLRVLQSQTRLANRSGAHKTRYLWSPISRVTISLIDVRTVLRPVAHVIAQDGIHPRVDIYAGSGRKYIPYGATVILSGETPGVNANLLLTEWQQLEGPPWSLETETRRQAFFAPQPPSKVREPGNYRFRFNTRLEAGETPFTDEVAFTVLPPPMSQRAPPVCFDGLAKNAGPVYDQIDPAAVGLRLTATASTTPAVGGDFDPEDTGAPAPSSLTVTLPTTVTLDAQLLGGDLLGYAAYDFYWVPIDGPSTELTRYQDLSSTTRGSQTRFAPTTGGVYEFEAQATPYDENDRLMDVTFKRRLRVVVESEEFRAPSAQATASVTSVAAMGPATALTATLSARVEGLEGPSQDGTTPRTGGDFLPSGSFFSWVQVAGPAADLANPGATVTRVTFPESPGALEDQTYAFEFSVRTVMGGYSEPARVTVVQKKAAGPELVSNLARVFISGVVAGEVMPLTTSLLSGNLTLPDNLEDGEILTVEAVDEAGERLSPPVILRTLLIRLSPAGSNEAVSQADGVLVLSSSALGGQILGVFSSVPLPTPAFVQSPGSISSPPAGASGGVGGSGGGGGCRAFSGSRANTGGLDGLLPPALLAAILLFARRRRAAVATLRGTGHCPPRGR